MTYTYLVFSIILSLSSILVDLNANQTDFPTDLPTITYSASDPTSGPTNSPTLKPTHFPTPSPTKSTISPTRIPTLETMNPTQSPSRTPLDRYIYVNVTHSVNSGQNEVNIFGNVSSYNTLYIYVASMSMGLLMVIIIFGYIDAKRRKYQFGVLSMLKFWICFGDF